MKKVFELKPILVAAAIGAGLAYVFFQSISAQSSDDQGNVSKCLWIPTMVALQGAGVGIGVQIGVRLLGVS